MLVRTHYDTHMVAEIISTRDSLMREHPRGAVAVLVLVPLAATTEQARYTDFRREQMQDNSIYDRLALLQKLECNDISQSGSATLGTTTAKQTSTA